MTATVYATIRDDALAEVGFVRATPRRLLRLEGLAVFGLTAIGFDRIGGNWWLFALLFLAPDVSMLGYLDGRRIGSAAYNAAHSYIGPTLLATVGLIARSPTTQQVALIWAAHIGFDRTLGYGLKYPTAFGDTHLGQVGRPKGASHDR